MNPIIDKIDKIDKINEILLGVKAQTGAIAYIANPQHQDYEMTDVSDFFRGISRQVEEALKLVNELPTKEC